MLCSVVTPSISIAIKNQKWAVPVFVIMSILSLGKGSPATQTTPTRTVPGVLRKDTSASRTKTQDLTQREEAGVLMPRIRTTVKVRKEIASLFLLVMGMLNASLRRL